VRFTAHFADGRPLGMTTMKVFDKKGKMITGKQKLLFYFCDNFRENVPIDELSGELYRKYVAPFASLELLPLFTSLIA
jgi:hypothetical protein